jgi:hypothetical protein
MWTSRVQPCHRYPGPECSPGKNDIPTPHDSLLVCSPTLNLRYQLEDIRSISKVLNMPVQQWIKSSTNTAFYPRILSTCHDRRVCTSSGFMYPWTGSESGKMVQTGTYQYVPVHHCISQYEDSTRQVQQDRLFSDPPRKSQDSER